MEKLPNIKAVTFDLDGTTILSGGILPEENRRAMERAAEMGILMVPATGRSMEFLPKSLTSLSFIRYAMTSNGAAIWELSESKLLHAMLIDTDTALAAHEVIERFDIYVEYYVNGRAVTRRGAPQRMRERADFPREKLHLLEKNYLFVDDPAKYIKAENIRPEKINLMYIPEDVREDFFREIRAVDGLTFTYSNVDNMEINALDCNKGSGLLALCEVLGISPSAVMAIGDNGNDLEMLTAAGFPVAVDNAVPQVKAVCRAVVSDYRDCGFAEAVDKFAIKNNFSEV